MKIKFFDGSLFRIELKTSSATHSFELFPWYGLKNRNTSAFEYYYITNSKGQRGLTLLPLHFWTEFYCTLDGFRKYRHRARKTRRAIFGIGLISIFFDYKYENRN
jgi:hypothetical protein